MGYRALLSLDWEDGSDTHQWLLFLHLCCSPSVGVLNQIPQWRSALKWSCGPMRSFGMNVVQVVASNMYMLYTFGIWCQCQWSTLAVRTMIRQYLVVRFVLFVVNTLESLDMVFNLKFLASEVWSSPGNGTVPCFPLSPNEFHFLLWPD